MWTEYGWVPQELLAGLSSPGGFSSTDPYDALTQGTYADPNMSPEDLAAWQAQYWVPHIATGGFIPPALDNPEYMASIGQSDAYAQRQQFLQQQGAQRVANLQSDQARDRAGGLAARGALLVGALGGTAGILGAGAAGAGSAAAAPGPAAGGGSSALTGVTLPSGLAPINAVPGALGPSISTPAASSIGPSLGGGILGNVGGFMRKNPELIGGILGAADALSQPDSMTTNQGGTSSSTYSSTLPGEITGPAGEALASLRGMFGGGGAGVDPVTSAAIERLQGFGGTVNPYLDTVFNTAADATRGRLASEFAGAGRRVGGVDHQGFRSDELQQLAAGIYGPGFEAERSREFAAQPQLIGAGEYLRNIPFDNLLKYLGGLQGLMPFFPGTQTQNTTQQGSVTQPLFNNPWAGFLGGAQLGSIFGR